MKATINTKYRVYIVVGKQFTDGTISSLHYLQREGGHYEFDTELAAIDYIQSKKKPHPEQIFTIIKVY